MKRIEYGWYTMDSFNTAPFLSSFSANDTKQKQLTGGELVCCGRQVFLHITTI